MHKVEENNEEEEERRRRGTGHMRKREIEGGKERE